MLEAKIYVTLKAGVLDPQGKTVKGGLESLGYDRIEEVRLGKFMVIRLKDMPLPQAQTQLEEMCQRLLANPVIEDYRFEIVQV
jgi:phosphoribosylformylglycinamidine synthase